MLALCHDTCNLGAWFEKIRKRTRYTWIVGHLLNQRNNSTEPLVKNQLFKCYLIKKMKSASGACSRWQTQRAGLWTGAESGANSNFCQTIYRHCGFYFHLLFMRDLPVCKNNPHMFHFKLFALFWYCNTSNGAQRTRVGWGGGTLESDTQRLGSLRKRSTQKILCCASYPSATRSLWKDDIVGKWETWKWSRIFLHLLRRTISKL